MNEDDVITLPIALKAFLRMQRWCNLIENQKEKLKGTVARDFWLLFFYESTPYGPLIHTLKHFRILVRILGDIQI